MVEKFQIFKLYSDGIQVSVEKGTRLKLLLVYILCSSHMSISKLSKPISIYIIYTYAILFNLFVIFAPLQSRIKSILSPILYGNEYDMDSAKVYRCTFYIHVVLDHIMIPKIQVTNSE